MAKIVSADKIPPPPPLPDDFPVMTSCMHFAASHQDLAASRLSLLSNCSASDSVRTYQSDSDSSYIGLENKEETLTKKTYRESRAKLIRSAAFARSKPPMMPVPIVPQLTAKQCLAQQELYHKATSSRRSSYQMQPLAMDPKQLFQRQVFDLSSGGWNSGYSATTQQRDSNWSLVSTSSNSLTTQSHRHSLPHLMPGASLSSIVHLKQASKPMLEAPLLRQPAPLLAKNRRPAVQLGDDQCEVDVVEFLEGRRTFSINKIDGYQYEMLGCIGMYEYGFVLMAKAIKISRKKQRSVEIFDGKTQTLQVVLSHSSVKNGSLVYVKMVKRDSETSKAVERYVNPNHTVLAQMKLKKKHLPELIKVYNESDYTVIMSHTRGTEKSSFFGQKYHSVEWLYYFTQLA